MRKLLASQVIILSIVSKLIFPSFTQAQTPPACSGYVYDDSTGLPIAGVEVAFQAGHYCEVIEVPGWDYTDSTGYWEAPGPYSFEPICKFTFRALGYIDAQAICQDIVKPNICSDCQLWSVDPSVIRLSPAGAPYSGFFCDSPWAGDPALVCPQATGFPPFTDINTCLNYCLPDPSGIPFPTVPVPTNTPSPFPTFSPINWSGLYTTVFPTPGAFGQINTSLTIGTFVNALLTYAFPFAGLLMMLFLLYGGYKFLTSGNNPQRAESAKKVITYAIFGFIIIFLAFWIVQVVARILGTPGVDVGSS